MSDNFLSNEDGFRISPAVSGLQQELIEEFAKNGRRSTNDIKFQVLTLAASSAVGTPEIQHSCNSVKIMTILTDVYMGDEDDDQPVLLIQNIWLELPLNNVGQLRFKSATGGAVYLISSN